MKLRFWRAWIIAASYRSMTLDVPKTASAIAVSKFVEGSDLATRKNHVQLSFAAAAELVAIVAEALQYSHSRKVIHRDIKPANILIDTDNRPYITDFGIALKEEDWGKDRPTAGTPAYMSPEQVRGEGHLVDGRSDVFSLGIVLYELLTGRRPFGRTWDERLEWPELRPPRRIDDAIPVELERICLKALAHRVSERFRTAGDMADDLRHFIDQDTASAAHVPRSPRLTDSQVSSSSDQLSATEALTIVPKGLRSFDRSDADFFLELLPGPRDRDGLPESVRFWKTRILQRDLVKTFRVGLVYGPSGCGKSSFLKAAVLPSLPEKVNPVYLEATPDETEARILSALWTQCPDLPRELGLVDAMSSLRKGHYVQDGSKVLIVIDQFEQWLHSRAERESDILVNALRQCDGAHLQCIVCARDDFWMAVTHFMDDIDVSLVPERNVAALDLFSVRHSRKVLTAMGRAYKTLPPGHESVKKTQRQFVERAVGDLADNGRVIPVHLALFAEMVKDKEWAPATLQQLGGTAGVGVTFLEETFNGRGAVPRHRLHQNGARGILARLLSEQGGQIKGSMRSYRELMVAAHYENRPAEFDALLKILDSELRLITPTDPAGHNGSTGLDQSGPGRAQQFYHLTHDYLVPSITEWVSRKKKETRQGRAELLLEERTKSWNAHPSTRTLPSLSEWLRILVLASPRNRDHLHLERSMMRQAGKYHIIRLVLLMTVVAVVSGWIYHSRMQTRAFAVVESLQSAATEDVPELLDQIDEVRDWVAPVLPDQFARSVPDSRGQLHLSLALLRDDHSQSRHLFTQVLAAAPTELALICSSLKQHMDLATVTDYFRPILLSENQDSPSRFRAAAVLAAVEAPDFAMKLDESIARFVSNQLLAEISENRLLLHPWVKIFHPVREDLRNHLSSVFEDNERGESDREVAALILAEYVANNPEHLVELLLKATPKQHRIVLPRLEYHREPAVSLLQTTYDQAPTNETYDERSILTTRRARAAALLFVLGEKTPAWNALGQTEDIELTSVLEVRLAELGSRAEEVYAMLQVAQGSRLKAALLRVLGGFSRLNQRRLSASLRAECLSSFEHFFVDDPDSGVHSAAEIAMKRWEVGHRLDSLKNRFISPEAIEDRNWYVTESGVTMAVFRGVTESLTGSPEDEPGRDESDETLTVQPVGYDFAMATTEVTRDQYLDFDPHFRFQGKPGVLPGEAPIGSLNWHQAAAFCLWLSKKEGIPEHQWCFVEDKPAVIGRISADNRPPEMRSVDDCLLRTGYRLATEAEWEYCCRAGSRTKHFWGNTGEIAAWYAWYSANSQSLLHPVGSLMPNTFGMYDMLGNVSEWSLLPYSRNPNAAAVSHVDAAAGSINQWRAARGSSATKFLKIMRSGNRLPALSYTSVNQMRGLRLVRTVRD